MDKDYSNILLDTELNREISKLKDLEPGSVEHSKAVESVSVLAKAKNEYERGLSENAAKEEQLREEKKDHRMKWAISIAGIVVPAAIYTTLSFVGFNFEKTGRICSDTMRRALNGVSKLFKS
jgi:hypothetical protein